MRAIGWLETMFLSQLNFVGNETTSAIRIYEYKSVFEKRCWGSSINRSGEMFSMVRRIHRNHRLH